MGYTGHADPGGYYSTRGPHPDSTSRVFSIWRWLSVAVVVAAWAWFGMAVVANPGALHDIWAWAGDLSLAGQIVIWVVALPWLAAIGIWQSGWADMVRLLLILAVAVVSIWTFLPERRVT